MLREHQMSTATHAIVARIGRVVLIQGIGVRDVAI